jgi:hypothetical protein
MKQMAQEHFPGRRGHGLGHWDIIFIHWFLTTKNRAYFLNPAICPVFRGKVNTKNRAYCRVQEFSRKINKKVPETMA